MRFLALFLLSGACTRHGASRDAPSAALTADTTAATTTADTAPAPTDTPDPTGDTASTSPCAPGPFDPAFQEGYVRVHVEEDPTPPTFEWGAIEASFFRVNGPASALGEIVHPSTGLDDCAVARNGYPAVYYPHDERSAGTLHYDLGGATAVVPVYGDPDQHYYLQYPSVSFKDDLGLEPAATSGYPLDVSATGDAIAPFDLTDVVVVPEVFGMSVPDPEKKVDVGSIELRWSPGAPGSAPLYVQGWFSVPGGGDDVYSLSCSVGDDGYWQMPAAMYDAEPAAFFEVGVQIYRKSLCWVPTAGDSYIEIVAQRVVRTNFYVKR